MENWQKLLKLSIKSTAELARVLPIDRRALEEVISTYPMRINPYYLSLIRGKDSPIGKQAIPSHLEIEDGSGLEDPLREERQSPVPNLVHRYPDRVLFLISNQCAMYCRFCTRKRKVGRDFVVSDNTLAQGLAYIAANPAIRDVLLSGGDPLLLSNERLEDILTRLRRIPHVEIVRIGSRVPCTLPQRVTRRLAALLHKFPPLYINVHFNHPEELTPEASLALGRLADAGIPLGCQTVLLRGVNDSPAVMLQLMRKLVALRVRPYYLYQADLTKGTEHFRTPTTEGLAIMEALRGHTSGLCVPQFIIDTPGGGGKIPVLPNYLVRQTADGLVLRNHENHYFLYPEARSPRPEPETKAEPVAYQAPRACASA
ncbi:MAG: KamA family radical SAM protein [Pseudomonadota bacterium]